MRQRFFRTFTFVMAVGLLELLFGSVQQAVARDFGTQGVHQYRSHGRAFSDARRPFFSERGSAPGFSQREFRSGSRHEGRYGRHYPDRHDGGHRRHDHDFRHDGFADRDHGWRERQHRFNEHRRGHDRYDRRGHDPRWPFGRERRPLPRYDHQYGNEIMPADRSWMTRSDIVDDDDDDRAFYFGVAPPYGWASVAPTAAYLSGAKWIDVAADRLDRRPVGHDGIDVSYVGGSKIIRLASNYSGRRQRAKTDLQPWSPAWLRHCTSAYRSFDPSLGTYVASNGTVRFCEAR